MKFITAYNRIRYLAVYRPKLFIAAALGDCMIIATIIYSIIH